MQALLKILKWLLVGVGTVAALLIAWSYAWRYIGYRVMPEDTAEILEGKGCKFAFSIPNGFWKQDDVTGSPALIRDRVGKQPMVYLYGQRWWKPSKPGEWMIVSTEFKCRIEPRGTIKSRNGTVVPTYLATRCQTGPNAWPQFQNANVLYSQTPEPGGEVDIIYMTSPSLDDLLRHEREFRHVAASHFLPATPGARCVRPKK